MRGNGQRVVLPESMNQVVDAIGVSAALSIVLRWAGRKLYVPRPEGLTDEHELVELLGMPLAWKLASAIGSRGIGRVILIPQCQRMLLDQRDAEILRRGKPVLEGGAGQSAFVIAQDYGLTDRAVRSILARQRAEERA